LPSSPSYTPDNLSGSADKIVSTDILVNLLAEYAALLRERNESLDVIQRRQYSWLIGYLSVYISGVMVDFLILKTPFLGISYITVAALSISPLLVFWYFRERRKSQMVKAEIEMISQQLKRVVDRASATEDHIELSFGKRFELDLRLTDAEIALRQAARLLW